MKRNLFSLLLLLLLFSSLLGFTNLNTNPDQPFLIQITIKNTIDQVRVKQLPMAVYLRTDDYVIATIEPGKLSLLEDGAINFKILDRNAWSKPYFLINKNPQASLNDLPPIGEIVLQTDGEMIVKASMDATHDVRNAGFHISMLPDHAIPMNLSSQRTLHDYHIEKMQHPIIGAIIEQVSDSFIRAGIQRLEDFQTRHSATDSVYAAGQWIYEQFKSYGYEDVKFDTLDQFVEGRLQRNVLAIKRGTTYPDSVIIIGGHYDSIVFDGTDARVYAPGADDNATGTLAAMEAARILADIDLEATVIFAAWAAEEQGLHGAWDFARKANNQNMNIGGYLNFDMIGNLIEQDPLRDVSFYINSASRGLAELMQEMAFLYTTLEPRFATASGGSDHWPFLQMGFHAVGVEEGDFSPHWHRRTDVIENVNIPYANEVIRMGLATLLHLAGPPKEIAGPYVTFNSINFDDDHSGRSVGNGNQFLDPGETIELSVSLRNAGNTISTGITATLQSDDPYITILDSTKYYGDIAPGDSAVIADQFLFSVSRQAPANRSIVFSLDVQDSHGDNWKSQFLFKINQPRLVLNNFQIAEITGDDDQIPDAGETCNISFFLGNYGTRPAKLVEATLSTYDPDISILDNQASIDQISMDSVGINSEDPFVIQIKDTALPHRVSFRMNIQEGEGYYSTTAEFNILLEQGRVLLVIDDGNANKSAYYSAILEEFGVPTDPWHVASQGPVPQQMIQNSKNIIWFTGTEPINTLTADDQGHLKSFLDNGGNLFLSGQLLGFNIKDSDFFKNYIHASFVNLRSGLHHLQATSENVITTLDSIAIASSGSAYQTFTSESDPISPAYALYKYNTNTSEGSGDIRSTGTAIHAVDNGIFKLIYMDFGFEGIIGSDTRKIMMSDILSWFKGAPLDNRAILSVADFSIDDDSAQPSQGDGDGFINPGETIELHINLKNTGTLTAKKVKAVLRTNNNYAAIQDSIQNFGEISSLSSATNTGAFTFTVGSAAPHQTPLHFDLVITDSTGNRWDEKLTMTTLLTNTLSGEICDAGTKAGIPGATLFWTGPITDAGGASQGQVAADSSGHYNFSGPIGLYAFRAWTEGYILTDLVLVEFPPDTTIDFELTSPQLAVAPDSITISLNAGESLADTMTLENLRTGELFYTLLETNAAPMRTTMSAKSTGTNLFSINLSGIQEMKNSHSASSNFENSIAPDPAKWKLMHIDPDEPEIKLDIDKTYIQNDANDIFFKITAHQKWDNPATDFIFAIFIDTDLNFSSGMQINDIGADYVIALGSIGNVILSWTGNGWNPIPGNSVPYYLLLQAETDSLEVGIHLSQIRNPGRIHIVNSFLVTEQTITDAAPDNGLYHIPYCMFDAPWLCANRHYGAIPAGQFNEIILNFNTNGLAAGSYQTNLEIINNQPDGISKIIPVRLNVVPTSVADAGVDALPTEYALHPNYPNPFNPETMIKYQIPEAGAVKLEIYNLMGQKIKTLVHEIKKAGYYQVRWDGKTQNEKSAASGVYFYRLEAGQFVAVKKMLLIQ